MTISVVRLRAFSPWLGVWLSVPLLIGAWWIGSPGNLAKWFAATGSIVAVLGVLTLGRPVIRLGYREWFKASNFVDGGEDPPPPTQIEEERQSNLDAKALQVSGPVLITFGTLLNGFSGFF